MPRFRSADYWKEYKRRYRRTPESVEKRRKYRLENRDEINAKKRAYFQENKQKAYDSVNKYRKKDAKKWSKSASDSRKRRVERLRAEGCINAWTVVHGKGEAKYENNEIRN